VDYEAATAMTCSYQIDKNHKLVIGFGKGIITKREMMEYLQAIKKDRSFDPSYDFIEETKDITELRLNSVELQELAQVLIFNPESRRAQVAADNLPFAVSRMYEGYRELSQADNFCVFRNKEDALQWINEGRVLRNLPLIESSFDPFASL
jgi:hypothetical protein